MNQKEPQTTGNTTESNKIPHLTYEEYKSNDTGKVCETAVKYGAYEKRQGEYTLEDYRNWPKEERVELIEGEILVMEAPNTYHQIAIGKLFLQFENYISQKKGSCMAMFSPLDVQLDEDERTMLQPDMVIICDPKRLKKWGIFGAPDFVLEVVSPSTRLYDMVRKKNKYIAAGVREYWILDPDKRLVITYTEKEHYSAVIYPLEGKIGVSIYENDLEIDLEPIKVILDTL